MERSLRAALRRGKVDGMGPIETDHQFHGSVPELYQRLMVPLIFEPYAEDLVRRLAGRPLRSVLELAAGTGVFTRELAALTTESVEIVATDLNSAMLEMARSRGTARPVRWEVADAANLPYAPKSFDAAVCQFGVMFPPDKVRMYAEVRRVLRPGGLFLFNTWDRLEESEFAWVASDAIQGFFPEDPPWFFSRTPHGYHDLETIRQEMSDAGFDEPIAIETVQKTARADSARTVATAYCQGTPMRGEIERRGAALEEVTDAVTEALVSRFGSGPVEGRLQAFVVSATV